MEQTKRPENISRISEVYVQHKLNACIYLRIRSLLRGFEEARRLDRKIAGYGIIVVIGVSVGFVAFKYFDLSKPIVF